MNLYKKDRHLLRRFLRRCTSIPNKDIRKMSYKKLNSMFLKFSTYAVRYLLDKYGSFKSENLKH